jgi:hypothetical protein
VDLSSGQEIWGAGDGGAKSDALAAVAAAGGFAAVTAATQDAAARLSTNVSYGTAMFDFTGQATEDLEFIEGDTILILERTQIENDWWRGKNMRTGKEGVFPSNYIQSN